MIGEISVTVSDGQGCFGDDTVNVIEVLPPVVQLEPAISLCNTEAGGSLLNLFDLIISGDLNGTWEDVDQSGAVGLFNSLNFKGVAAGDYKFSYTTNSAVAPCPETTWETVVTVIDCVCPDVFFLNTNPLCNGGDVLDLSTIENTTENGSWSLVQTPPGSNPGMLNGNVFSTTGGDPGEYIFQFTLQDQQPPGCPADFQVSVIVDDAVDAGVAGVPIRLCEADDQIVDLAGIITGEDANGTWTETSAQPSQGNAFNANNGSFATVNQLPGQYTFEYSLTSQGVCPDDAVEVSVVINPLPAVVIANASEFDCSLAVQSLDATGSSNGVDFDLQWIGPGIVLDGNENTLGPTIDQPGIYQLIIWNISTGCTNTSSITVTANTNAPTEAAIDSHGPECFGESNGVIEVNQVIGGEAPYLYSLDNGPFGSGNVFSNLGAGDHTIEVEDANGCKWDTLIPMIEPSEISIDLGPDIEISLG